MNYMQIDLGRGIGKTYPKPTTGPVIDIQYTEECNDGKAEFKGFHFIESKFSVKFTFNQTKEGEDFFFGKDPMQ